MIVVVSDTSPLNYLVLIKKPGILPALFGSLIAPPAVLAELSRPDTPEAVREWVQNRPPWLRVQAPRSVDPTIDLHPGEREAIALAEELNATRVLIDDKEARRVAIQRGLRVAGTLAILSEAAERGLLSLPEVLEDLGRTSFRADENLIQSILERSRKSPPRQP